MPSSAKQERIGAHNQRPHALLDERRERGIDLSVAAGIDDTKLAPETARRLFEIQGLGRRFGVRIEQQRDDGGVGNELKQELPVRFDRRAISDRSDVILKCTKKACRLRR